jgi:hypothetical protein
MKRSFSALIAGLALTACAATQAAATTYNFVIDYYGSGNASLALGSDDLLASAPVVGDTINYSIVGVNGFWTTRTAGAPSIFGAIGDLSAQTGNVDFGYSASFIFMGVQQYAESGTGSQGNADLGPRSLAYASGMRFDTFSETITLSNLDNSSVQFSSLLPAWPGEAPEAYPGYFSYSSVTYSVPEPSTWVMMLAGFGGLALVARRRNGRAAMAS